MKPSFWFSFDCCLSNPFFDFKFNEISSTASSKDHSKSQCSNGCEQCRAYTQCWVDIEITGSEFHESDSREDDRYRHERQDVSNKPSHGRHHKQFQKHHALQTLPIRSYDTMNTDLATSLFKGQNQPVNENGNGQKDDWNHDDVVKDLNQSKEDVEEKNGS